MYGYEPPKPEQNIGSWGEIFALIRASFIELGRPIVITIVLSGLVVGTMLLLFSYPIYALAPVSVLAGIGWMLLRRDRRAIRDAEDSLPR
ncbi:MAG: hypothetical protein EXR64_02125 [Dehalococcoidia bacterium]|nr:hypothetical protein [Dehalococcoidia bacterium]